MEILDIGDDDFNKWIINNQKYIKFYKNDNISELSNEIQKSLVDLKSFLEIVERFMKMYERKIVEKPLIPSIHRKLSNESAFLSRIHFYVQIFISEIREDIYQKICNSTHKFIDYFKSHEEKINEYSVSYNERNFLTVLFGEIPKIQQLIAFDSSLIKSISSNELDLGDKASQSAILRNILFSQRTFYDHQNCIVHHNPHIIKFEQLIYHESFYFSPNIMLLVDRTSYSDPKKFSQGCLEVINKIIEEFDISDEDDKMILRIIFFRSIFSTVFINATDFFTQKNEQNFRSISDKISLEDIAVNPEFLPLTSKEEEIPLKQILNKNERLVNCSNNLILLSFMTSPFDILSVIHYILSEIKLYAVEHTKNKDEAFTFDCIFGIFLFILVCSDFPNVEEIFHFVQLFYPEDSISGPLSYAYATINATLLQCDKLVKIVQSKS